ncbi:MAG: hypothetical protein KAT57_13580, partial [Candidatus Lokiarchaeota archaeon]|nr:hypothetical protein [Candidatus Lokiarchaeota archaeon]
MNKSEFYDIVKMDDIRVSIPKTSHFSVGTSPYYAHQHGLAIDLYQNLSLKNYEALSPVSGKILKIKSLAAPKPKFPDGIDRDYLILISNPNNSEILWKLMHVKPDVKVGEQIEVGDPLGTTIKNGYFAYWSSPHLHLEIRPIDDAIRARGGKNFELVIEKKDISEKDFEEINPTHIPIKIHSVYPEMILACFPEYFYYKHYPIYGVKIRADNLNCILDGGIPHYKIGTVLFQKKFNFKIFPSISLGSNKIGTLHEINGQFGLFKFNYIKFLLNNKEIRGISLYLA